MTQQSNMLLRVTANPQEQTVGANLNLRGTCFWKTHAGSTEKLVARKCSGAALGPG